MLIAERILAALQEPWVVENHEFQTTSSIGIAFYLKDGIFFGELLQYADTVMYEAKHAGRNNIKVYSAYKK